MERKILAVVVGMITAVAVIWITYMVGTVIAPSTPANLEYAKQADIVAYMRNFSTTAFVAVGIGYALAGFAGGFITTKMGRRWSAGMSLALIVGGLLTLGSLVMATMWPQPVSFVIASVLIFIPSALVGYRLADHATGTRAMASRPDSKPA